MKNRIKELRTQLNITQGELAEAIGVRRETIIYLEQGKYNPSLKLAFQVAEKLQTTIPELFIFEDE
jgi:putative transcriptional regulator